MEVFREFTHGHWWCTCVCVSPSHTARFPSPFLPHMFFTWHRRKIFPWRSQSVFVPVVKFWWAVKYLFSLRSCFFFRIALKINGEKKKKRLTVLPETRNLFLFPHFQWTIAVKGMKVLCARETFHVLFVFFRLWTHGGVSWRGRSRELLLKEKGTSFGLFIFLWWTL